jgi:rubrerythrin
MTETLQGASVWEQEIYDHLVTHVDKERGILETYRDAAKQSGSRAFEYLVDLIIDEEVRHHKRFQELASALRTDAEMRREQPAIPRMDWYRLDPKVITGLTEELISQEREDADELRRLRRQLRDVEDTTLWVLLVRLMEADTAKHLDILKFIREHAKL